MTDIETAEVAIILLNYGHVEKTLACLDSLKLVTGPSFRIFVVDNASPDDSVIQLKARLAGVEAPAGTDEISHPWHKKPLPEDAAPEFVLIESPRNLGYSGGCNLAIRSVRAMLEPPQYIWLLNNDTMADPAALSALVQESRQTAGLVGSLLLYPDGSYQQVGTHFNRWTGRARGYKERDTHDGMSVEMLSGASLLIPIRAISRVGLLDERFFLYFEDGEYCLRCAHAGFKLTVATKSRIYHHEGASTGKRSSTTQYYYQRNRLKLLWQVVPPLQKATIAAYALFRLGRSYLKCLPVGSVEKQNSNRLACRIYQLAIQDFILGVDGPCPHTF
jgi:GT2 family glycosyltransferase